MEPAMTARTSGSQILVTGGIEWHARQPGVLLRIA
jgi:hypothetical protein